MTTRRRPLIGSAGVSLMLSLVCGCSTSPRNTSAARSPLSRLKADSGTKLVLSLVRDTIVADDQAALEVNYYIVNGPKRTTFDNEPGFFRLQVQTVDGRPINPSNPSSPASGSLGETKISLPARAILGQVVNLRCVQDGAGYAGGDPAGVSTNCLGSYPLHERGSYRIVLDYSGPEFTWQQAAGATGRGAAALDTGATLKVIPNARHMADTAILVVR
jgi:hypothetical protein